MKPTSARRKTVIGKLVLPFGAVIFSLLLAELALRLFDYGATSSPLVPHPRLHHVHPSNYTSRVYSPRGDFGDHGIRYDQNGFRVPLSNIGTASPNESRRTSNRIAFIGDSFVEARQVTYQKSFVGIIAAEKPCVEALNLGVSSYSPILSSLQLKEHQDLLSPDFVIHILMANDSGDDKRYRKIAVTDRNEKILAVPGENRPIFLFLRKFYLARLVRRAQLTAEHHLSKRKSGLVREREGLSYRTRIYADTKQALLDIEEWSQSRRARYAISCVPERLKYNAGVDKVNQFCDDARTFAQQRGLDYIDLDAFFDNYANEKPFFELDTHWNEYGHSLVASAINKYLDKMEIDCSEETVPK